MDCACSGFVFLCGLALIIVALVLKGIPLGPTRMISASAACTVGAALMIPLCCGQGAIMSYGGYLGYEYATKYPGKQKQLFDPQMQAEIQQQALIPVLIINAVVFLLALGIAVPVALLGIKPRTPNEPPQSGYTPPPPPDPGYRPGDHGIRPGGPGNWPAGS